MFYHQAAYFSENQNVLPLVSPTGPDHLDPVSLKTTTQSRLSERKTRFTKRFCLLFWPGSNTFPTAWMRRKTLELFTGAGKKRLFGSLSHSQGSMDEECLGKNTWSSWIRVEPHMGSGVQ